MTPQQKVDDLKAKILSFIPVKNRDSLSNITVKYSLLVMVDEMKKLVNRSYNKDFREIELTFLNEMELIINKL